jgi:hypothetical protein
MPPITVVLYSCGIFCSAALLFVLQPMFAKMVLPVLGGAPSVWNTAMVFYQAVLLAAYYYAHRLTLHLSLRTQVILHLLLLCVPLALFPIAIPAGWDPPMESSPVGWLLALLAVSVGLPCFAVSATSPLLQKWFSRTSHARANDPYFLYVASNLGSFLALMAYPVVVERTWDLFEQSQFWAWGYGVFVVLMGGCGWVVLRQARYDTAEQVSVSARGLDPIPWRRRLGWVGLAWIPSSLMLGFTLYLTTDIAVVPLFWVLPLGAYLLTFQIAFSEKRKILLPFVHYAMPTLVFLSLMALGLQLRGPLSFLVPLHFLTFFCVSLVCHSRLADRRPEVSQLTSFYFSLSVGGVLGGISCALVAPMIFTFVWEYPLTLAVFCLCGLHLRDDEKPRETISWLREAGWIIGFGAILWLFLRIVPALPFQNQKMLNILVLGVAGLGCFYFSRQPIRFGGMMIVILLIGHGWYPSEQRRLLTTERNFFGVLRVVADDAKGLHHLFHGTTLHGSQVHPVKDGPASPLSYYHQTGPLGDIFEALYEARVGQNQPVERVALVGLGAGAAAYYARSGQTWDLYEIDPMVCRYASDEQYFTFLRDSRASHRMIMGDGRLNMGRAPDGAYQAVIMDVYSSDAIPVHMITQEALDLYFQKLAPGGWIAFHITNRYLALESVLANLAHARGWAALVREDFDLLEPEKEEGKAQSQWLVMARAGSDLVSLSAQEGWRTAQLNPALALWTDRFSSLFSVFHWNGIRRTRAKTPEPTRYP